MRASLLRRSFVALGTFVLTASFVFAQVDTVPGTGLPGAIPDDAYIGALDGNDGTGVDAGMICSSVDNTGGTVVSITDVQMDISMTHTWLGDLTVKIMSPDGSILAAMARPLGDGATNPSTDDNVECCGDSSNLDGTSLNFSDFGTTDAEAMGSTIGSDDFVCTTDGFCSYTPNPDVAAGLSDFAGFAGEDSRGVWEVCVGDGAGLDTGTFDAVSLTFRGAVPVELVSFDALVNGTDLRLEWATASETNNAGFEVQMQEGENWNVLSFIDGHGTTSEAQTYGFDVGEMAVGSHTFRLKQIDFDGTFEYSGELEVSIETPGTHALSNAYPNPFNPQSQFTLSVSQEQLVTAELYNTLGQRVATLFNGTVEANQTQNVTIDGTGLASGLYIVRVNGESFSDALQVTLLK